MMTKPRYSPERIRSDFLARIVKDDPAHPGCWIYPTEPKKEGSTGTKSGYAYVKDFERRSIGAHVFMVELATGKKVPEGFDVHHRTDGGICTSRKCVRFQLLPTTGEADAENHLLVVTKPVNARLAVMKRSSAESGEQSTLGLVPIDGELVDPEHYKDFVRKKKEEAALELANSGTPELQAYYRDVAYTRLMERIDMKRQAAYEQEQRESKPLQEWFSTPKIVDERQLLLDETFGKGKAAFGYCRRCEWEVVVYLEPTGEENQYTYAEMEGVIKPHPMVCIKRTRVGYDDFRSYSLWTQMPETPEETLSR